MRALITGLACGLLLFSATASATSWGSILDFFGHGSRDRDKDRGSRSGQSFNRIATFANYTNRDDAGDTTVSEIVAATADGRTLVATDAASESIGFTDISDPANPQPIASLPMGGEPTSVDIIGNHTALVGVNTSPSFVAPSGVLAVVDIASRSVVTTLDLGGQPDSLKISPDGHYAAIAIENERDEDVEVDGLEGGLPQLPAGFLAVIDLYNGGPFSWAVVDVAMPADRLEAAGCYAPTDAEPEFVDINDANLAVVSLQENNCLVIVDLDDLSDIKVFNAGTVTLTGVDATDDGVIDPSETLSDVAREPDAITWISRGYGEDRIATANEGDLFGGSRGFSIFSQSGKLIFDSGAGFEEIAVRHGHYPEARSDAKGAEPEAIAFGRFGFTDYLFVGSERGSFVAVYKLDWSGKPIFDQLLPAPLGPEGLLLIPSRNLLVVSGEEDDPSFGVRSTMMIYRLERGEADYPQLISKNDASGKPIPWSAMSGMTSAPGRSGDLLAVWDSFYADSYIFRIDPSATPARITARTQIIGGTGNYDPEGITVAPDDSYWIASEGNGDGSRPNRLLQTDDQGNVLQEVGLPAQIEACRAASGATATLGSGFEGVASIGTRRNYFLLVAQQRGWDYTTPECEALDDDAAGLDANGQPLLSRIWIYSPNTGKWGHIAWELSALPENASWVGLSEVTFAGLSLIVIERDNRTGDWTELKTLAAVNLFDLIDSHVAQSEKSVYDLLPAMRESNGWISDKPEGVAVDRTGELYLVTDNDGVDDWSGETSFLRLGRYFRLFR
jgi:hypothetical protein